MTIMNKKSFILWMVGISIAGILLRWMGIWYEGVDCVVNLSWYHQLQTDGGLKALANFRGNYNMFFATILLVLTYIPITPIISLKVTSILFDYLMAVVLMKILMQHNGENNKYFYGLLAYGIVVCNPIAIINSGYLAQTDSIWVFFALLSFYYINKDKPVAGMIWSGFAIAMKLQAIFILPILMIIYFTRKKFTILHILWIPLTIQVLCIPAVLGGCDFFIGFRKLLAFLGEYPYMYYYYPNIWTFFKELPYYVFSKLGIFLMLSLLLVFAVLFIKSKRQHTLSHYLEYIAWTTMTCAMLLPCMHERYNYISEIVYPLCAIHDKKHRVPAGILVINSVLCYGQSYLGWSKMSHYVLATINVSVYIYVTLKCFRELYETCRNEDGLVV